MDADASDGWMDTKERKEREFVYANGNGLRSIHLNQTETTPTAERMPETRRCFKFNATTRNANNASYGSGKSVRDSRSGERGRFRVHEE